MLALTGDHVAFEKGIVNLCLTENSCFERLLGRVSLLLGEHKRMLGLRREAGQWVLEVQLFVLHQLPLIIRYFVNLLVDVIIFRAISVRLVQFTVITVVW